MASVLFRSKDYLEALDDRQLSPLASSNGKPVKHLKTGGRSDRESMAEPQRTRFQLDRDRILYSGSFRRLQYKTQVFATHEGDLYRTRMTHTLEVMQIARSLARSLGLNEMLTETIALAHDIGHPPFGHSGERALSHKMADRGVVIRGYGIESGRPWFEVEIQGFEHNVHGLRVVDEVELSSPDTTGLNLCWETREGIARHSTDWDRPPVSKEFTCYRNPSAECQVVNVADLIAYDSHDIDDALRIGLVNREWINSQARHKCSPFRKAKEEAKRQLSAVTGVARREREEYERSMFLSFLIRALIRNVVDASEESIANLGIREATDLRNADRPAINFSTEMLMYLQSLSKALKKQIYKRHVVERMASKGEYIIEVLFDKLSEKPELMPAPTAERVKKAASEAEKAIFIGDYIAGMTDRYAMDLHDMLFQPNVKTTDLFGGL